jgi:hypothetical protein
MNMLDQLAFAMSQDALRRQNQRFEGTVDRPTAGSSPSLGRVRLGVARRLRAVADRIEPVSPGATSEPRTMAIDRRDAA